MIKKALLLLAISVLPITSQASIMHHTDFNWSSERFGCNSARFGLECVGDGTGTTRELLFDFDREYTGTNNSHLGSSFTGFMNNLSLRRTDWSFLREDSFCDTDIKVSTVPLPGAIFMFGTALLGFMGFKRFNKQ